MSGGQAESPAREWDPFDDTDDYRDARSQGSISLNPVQKDPYKRCRPKHVVMLTDGFPRPEKSDGDLEVGSDALLGSFGYAEAGDRYVYDTAENEIMEFVTDANLTDVQAGEPKFLPKVHIVGLNVDDPDLETSGGDTTLVDVYEKLGRMAREGKTCALYQLLQGDGKRYVPEAWGSFGGEQGTCDPNQTRSDTNAANCLVQQLPAGDYNYKGIDCIAPALLLSQNDRFRKEDTSTGERPARDDLTESLQLVFNEVISAAGGVASRTQPAITNNLDAFNVRGQYRTFAGVDVSGGKVYWKGLLERQTLQCKNSGGALQSPPPPIPSLPCTSRSASRSSRTALPSTHCAPDTWTIDASSPPSESPTSTVIRVQMSIMN